MELCSSLFLFFRNFGRHLMLLLLSCAVLSSCTKTVNTELVPLWNIPAAPDHFGVQFVPIDNPLSALKWELGRALFFDTQLSIDGMISCASCHLPAQAFGGSTPTTAGANGAAGTRNVPALGNIGWHPYFTREGGVPTLEMQVLVPIQEANEFNHNIVLIAEQMAGDSVYKRMTQDAFGVAPSPFTITRALAAFERTLISGTSAYDRWVEGDASSLSQAALHGQEIFESIGCGQCHTGPQFSDFELRNNGTYATYPDSGVYRLTLNPDDIGKFKTPSLRNLSYSAPYMFDGSFATLDEVIENYAQGGSNHFNQAVEVQPFQITAAERSDLKTFLQALDDPQFVAWSNTLAP